ncbi:hypothetical protein CI109_101177 [Kwoniella shandongensis]|uniref:COP9 signalosome complex subunit 3 n=1 Tax=Kwoniella shandongensis TaxID=1734106 RepID=A0A5M6CAX0_9TREE|nr:uncharacterized protein CI109_001646 [Kwoniella shandongensis]KAA5530239.1 hypothetical protein CI109_001646 [Kwoniella shandongensis]
MGSNPPAPAHPAFPSLPPSSSRQTLPLPTKSSEVLPLIAYTSTSIQNVAQTLIPLLHKVAEGKGAEGTKLKEKERVQLGEEVLAAEKEDLYASDDGEVVRMTAGLVYILSARFNVSKRNTEGYDEQLLSFAIKLCNVGEPGQFHACPKRVSTFAWGLLRLAQHSKQIEAAHSALRSLVARSCLPNTFSGVLPAYLESCLLTKDFEAGRYVLDQMFLDVQSALPTYLDVLTYYHHAGLISAALKEYGKAKGYFVTVVSLPTQTASAIQLAAAKRAILCELLDTGKRITFPKYTSSAVNRVVERNAGVYIDLAKDYEAQKWGAVREASNKGVFEVDCNGGLIDQVLKSVTKRRIILLRETYSRLTASDLAQRVGLEGAAGAQTVLEVLSEMIHTGAISVSISDASTPGSAVVTFSDDVQDYGAPANLNKLTQVNHLAAVLEAELAEASRRLGISKEYLKKQANIIENATKAGKSSGGARMDDFDQMMAAEESGGGGRGVRGVGGNYNDMGF